MSLNTTTTVVVKLTGESRVPQILVGNILPTIVATVFFSSRVYARAVLLRHWGWDDSFLTVAWFGSVILCILQCISTKYGSGHHQADVPLSFLAPTLHIGYFTLIIYQLVLSLTKTSICFFYIRLFSDKTTKYIVYGTIAFIFAYTVPCLVLTIWQCKPVRGYWETTIPSVCLNAKPTFLLNAICNITIDAWLIAIVAPRVLALKMGRKQKVSLLLVLTMGWLVVIAGILRTIKLNVLFKSSKGEVDTSWTLYDTSIWSAVEVGTGIFCVSAPAIKPLLKKYAPGLLSRPTTNGVNSKGISSSRPTPSTGVQSKKWSSRGGGAIELSDQDQIYGQHYATATRGLTRQGARWRDSDVEGEAGSSTHELIKDSRGSSGQEIMKRTEIIVSHDIGDTMVAGKAQENGSIGSEEDLANQSYLTGRH